jgi:hypothetical protein
VDFAVSFSPVVADLGVSGSPTQPLLGTPLPVLGCVGQWRVPWGVGEPQVGGIGSRRHVGIFTAICAAERENCCFCVLCMCRERESPMQCVCLSLHAWLFEADVSSLVRMKPCRARHCVESLIRDLLSIQPSDHVLLKQPQSHIKWQGKISS